MRRARRSKRPVPRKVSDDPSRASPSRRPYLRPADPRHRPPGPTPPSSAASSCSPSRRRDRPGARVLPEPLQVRPGPVIYLLWVWTTDWVDDDTKELNNPQFEIWNCVVFFSGVLGLALRLGDPDLPARPDPAAPGLLHPAVDLHLRAQPDRARRSQGPHALPSRRGRQRPHEEDGDAGRCSTGDDRPDDRAGPPIDLHRQEPGAAKADPTRVSAGRGVAVVHVGQGARLRRRAPPGRPTSTSSRPPSSSRSATGSTASSTPPSRSTGPPATP